MEEELAARAAGVDTRQIGRVGRFFYVRAPETHPQFLDDQHVQLLSELSRYYTEPVLRSTIIPYVEEKSLSLRLLDWTCTNYSKSKGVKYVVEHEESGEKEVVYLHSLYKTYLKIFKRRLFDVFRRKKLIYFFLEKKGGGDGGGEPCSSLCSTTVGQLNYFKWAVRYKVPQYTQAHREEIEKHMNESISRSKILKNLTKQKRVCLSGKLPFAFRVVSHDHEVVMQ